MESRQCHPGRAVNTLRLPGEYFFLKKKPLLKLTQQAKPQRPRLTPHTAQRREDCELNSLAKVDFK